MGTRTIRKEERAEASRTEKDAQHIRQRLRLPVPLRTLGTEPGQNCGFFHYGALSTASTGYAENIYRLNSCYDPDYSGAGAQPLGFDQWAAFYNRYKVLSAKWKVQFASPTSLAESIVTVLPNLVNTIDNQGPYVMAEPYAKSSIFSTNGGWKPTLGDHMEINKIFGITEQEFGEESYTAAVGGSPVNVAYLHVRVDTASGGLSGSVYYLTEIEYDVEFYSRVELELSLWSEFLRFKQDKGKELVKETSQSQNPPPVVQDEKDVKQLLARLLNK